jgi:hypothetical protein
VSDVKPKGEEIMELATQSPEAGLQRLLALRAQDLDGWEASAADGVADPVAAVLRKADASFEGILSAWAEDPADLDVPDVRGSHFVGLAQDVEQPGVLSLPARRRRRHSFGPRWPQAAALAAGIALLCFGSWKVQQMSTSTLGETSVLPAEGWKAVSGDVATRLELQFSVERRLDSGSVVEPGRAGGTYGAEDSLILRVDLRGDPAWVYLFEQIPGAPPAVLHPTSGSGWRLQEGLHALSSSDGQPLAYRPDRRAGSTRYLAIATFEPIDAAELAAQVLRSGLDRPDLWPRPVRAVDSFVVDWME